MLLIDRERCTESSPLQNNYKVHLKQFRCDKQKNFILIDVSDDDDGLFKLHIIAYKMKYNVFTINKIIYYNCS